MNDYITIELSQRGKYKGMYKAIVDDADKELADLRWSVLITKTSDTQYACRCIFINSKKVTILLHREILEGILERKLTRYEQVDHINGHGLDNRRENLRLATAAQNQRNRGKQVNNTSGYKGVTWYKPSRKWRAQIMVKKKSISLGYFDNPEDAYKAYCEAADMYFGEFAKYEE